MVESATQFRKNGYNDQDAAQLALVASQFQNVADEQISAGEAADFLISQLIAFNYTAEDATHIIDAINEVSNSFSVSSADLSQGLSIVASTSSAMGNSMEETMGMLVAITEQTRSASRSARALNTIFARVTSVLDENSTTGSAVAKIFDDLGISMYDTSDQIRDTYDLLGDLSAKWETLDTNTQNYIAQTLAGTNQLNNFLALMNNFDHAIEATESGLNSAGSAAEENSRYMESLQAKVAQLETSFQELSNNVLSSDLAGVLLDIANSFLKLLNNPVGTFATQVALLGGAFWGGTGLLKAMKGVSQLLPGFITGINGAATATSALGAAAGLTAPQFYLISAAIVGVISLIGVLKDNIKSASEQFEESQQNLSEYNTQLDQNQQRLEELNNIPWYDRTPEIEKEIEQLKFENAELERNIELQKERSYGAAKESFSEGSYSYLAARVGINRVVAVDIENETARYWADTFAQQDRHYATVEEAARELAYSISGTFYDTAEETRAFLEGIGVNYDQLFEQGNYASEAQLSREEVNKIFIKQSKDFVDRMQEEFEATGEITTETKNLYDDLIDTYGSYVDEAQTIVDTQMATYGALDETGQAAQDYLDAWNSLIGTYSHIDEESRKIDQAIIDSRNSINSTIDSIKQLRQATNDLNIADAIEDTSNVLKTASDDLEQFGAIGSKAFNSLLSLAPDLTSEALSAQLGIEGLDGALFNANGTITDAGIVALNSSEGFQALAKAVLEAQIAINNAKIEDLKIQYKGYGENAKDLADNISRMAKEYGSLSAQRKDATLAYQENYQAQLDVQQEMLMLQESSANIQSILDNWQNVVFSTGGGGGGGSSGSVANVLDEIKDYLEKEEHKVFLLDKNDQEGNAQAIIDIYKNAQNVIHAYADKLRGLGYAEDSAEIRELQELWWEYQDNIEQVYENIRQIAEEKAAEAEEAWSEALQANIVSLQEQQSAYESLFNHMVSNIEEEIAALEEQKNAEEQYWDDKINALEEQNDELDRQLDLEKKMDALAKARQKKVMVYKDGRFQYIEDIDEVSAAQEELDEYNREEALRQEIENLEKLKEEAISNIDDQIEAWEEYKEAWSSIVDDYQKEQDRLLIEQQLGIDIENDNWKERLDNFKSFADEYINAMKELQAAQNEYNQGYQGPTADDYYDDIISSMQPTDNWEYLDSVIRGQSATLPNGRIVRVSIVDGHTQTKGLPVGSVVHTNGGDWQVTAVNSDGSYQSQKVNGYASGTLSASGGMSLVGENGPELRVINSGDGIIPAEITKNLWAWGNFSPGNLIGGLINTLSTMKENSGIIIQNFNPNLSNVTDGESFVAYLQNNFVGDVMQIVHA